MITHGKLGHQGQLGNQMFQFALLLGVAAKHGYEVGIPMNHRCARRRLGNSGRRRLMLFEVFCGIDARDSTGVQPRMRIVETRHEFIPEILEAPDGTDFEGFFQTERYFVHCADTVRRSFRFHEAIVQQAQDQLPADRPCVSVHVRRGDYKEKQDKFPLVPADWYAQALSRTGGGHPVVISDDPRWCRKHLPRHGFPSAATWISGNDAATDMCLMSLCDHHVIANSSFSWWGAWLNPSTTKCVVYPSKWFGPAMADRDTSDVPCPDWVGM